ncbi:uncharacterized protein LOC126798187 [Argentina anserina]|uniref:uncharacterized protein LOC126798187 n=1 Tax=Argentina anserina TaxID=57926 RepID=UPI0021767981|nr:uncharacterized protein LOC126798187 [Potentilla anserina]
MANDKSKHEDNPSGSPSLLQWFKEIEKNEAAKFRAPVGADDRTGPDRPVPCFPLPETEVTSNPDTKQMSVVGRNMMNDFTPFGNSQNPMTADSSVYGKGILPISDSDFLCCEGNTDFGYSVTPHSVANVCDLQKPYGDRDLVSAIDSAAALNSIQRDGDLNSNTSRPQLIDNVTIDGGSTLMSWPTLDGVDIDGSCLSLEVGCKSNDLSDINVGYVSDMVVLPQSNKFRSQNANRSLHLFSDVATSFSGTQNNMHQIEKQQQLLVSCNRNVSRGVEGNCNKSSLYIDPFNGIQGYPIVPILPADNTLARLPDSGSSKVNALLLSPCFNMHTSLPLSDQSPKPYIESGTRNTSLHNLFGKPVTVNEGVAAQGPGRGPFPEEFRFSQLPSNPYQPEVVGAVLSSSNLPGSVITGQEIPNTKINRAVQSSGTFVGTSVKRAAAETFTATSHAEASKARRTQFPTGLSVEAPSLEVASLKISSHEASFASRNRTSLSLLHEAKSTTRNLPQSQTRSALPPEVKGFSSLIRSAPSLPLHADSAPSFTPFPQGASSLPPRARSTRSLSSLSQTSPSLPLHAKSTPLVQSLSQTTSLTPQVKDISSLPSLSWRATSIQTQATSIPSLPPTNSYMPTKPRSNESLQRQSQMADIHLPQSKTSASLPLPSMTVPSRVPIGNTTSLSTLPQNGYSCPPHLQIASSHPSLNTIGRPLPSKSLRGSSLPKKPRTALPPRSQIALSLSSKVSAPSPLPSQSQKASPVPRKCIAPPLSPVPHTTAPVGQKFNVSPLLPQRQTDPVSHIKWNATDETQLIGYKCMICKRDLAFTPEGPVYVPPIAPMVAVLPCGHTFHDQCLHLITPEDEAKSPPCIPCAIGES